MSSKTSSASISAESQAMSSESGSTIVDVLRLAVIMPATDRPATLAACTAAIRSAEEPPEELIVVDSPPHAWSATARNAGAAQAEGEILVFVDADVAVHADVFRRIRQRFDTDADLSAVFGSYDDAPAAAGVVSVFRNLLHHHVHQSSAGPATTFWTGLSAIRRDVFESVGGFDDELAWIADIDLGMRLSARGARIELDPLIQGTHLKRWTLWSMIKTDFLRRGIPWTVLLLRHRHGSSALNLGWRHRASAASCLIACGALLRRRLSIALVATGTFVALNRDFYRMLLHRVGILRATLGVGLHALHHLIGVASVPAGIIVFLVRRQPRQ